MKIYLLLCSKFIANDIRTVLANGLVCNVVVGIRYETSNTNV